MTTIKAFIKRRPALTYFALTFAISWGGILIVVAPGGIPGTITPTVFVTEQGFAQEVWPQSPTPH